MNQHVLGIDIGGSNIKGAMVDLRQGKLCSERIQLKTPPGKSPEEIGTVIREMIEEFGQVGQPVGIGVPSVVMNGVTRTASNIAQGWIGFHAQKEFESHTGSPLYIINDADAAGIAEIEFGTGKDRMGTVILLTLGTGIGSAVFKNGLLLRNTELGRLHFKGNVAEYYASNSARKRENMSWPEYGKALNEVLIYINSIFNPDLMILGGGVSIMMDSFKGALQPDLPVCPATQYNDAGIVGAALAWQRYGSKRKGSH